MKVHQCVLWLAIAVCSRVEAEPLELVFGELGNFAWTKDGALFTFTAGDSELYVCDVHTSDCSSAPDPSWAKAHPSTAVKASRQSPDGGKAVVTLRTGEAGGAWKGGTWAPAAVSAVELGVERAGKTTVSSTLTGSIASLDVFWSPDGKRVAWVLVPSDRINMDSSRELKVVIGTAGLPRVQLLAEKSIVARALPVAIKALDAGGFVVTGAGRAKKAREASVVYAAAGQEEYAKKVAAALPGGATVDKLSWEANAELVVGLGSSVLKGGK